MHDSQNNHSKCYCSDRQELLVCRMLKHEYNLALIALQNRIADILVVGMKRKSTWISISCVRISSKVGENWFQIPVWCFSKPTHSCLLGYEHTLYFLSCVNDRVNRSCSHRCWSRHLSLLCSAKFQRLLVCQFSLKRQILLTGKNGIRFVESECVHVQLSGNCWFSLLSFVFVLVLNL